jgi:hypothetical protein
MSTGKRVSPTQVAKRLTMCERWLVNSNRHGVASLLNFIHKGVRYFNRRWLLLFLLSLVNIIKEGDNDNC